MGSMSLPPWAGVSVRIHFRQSPRHAIIPVVRLLRKVTAARTPGVPQMTDDERIRLLMSAYADVLGGVREFAARISARLEELRARFPEPARPGAQEPEPPETHDPFEPAP